MPFVALENPYPIFTAGVPLKSQPIQALVHWMHEAMAAVDNLPAGYTNDDLTAAMDVVNNIFAAIKQAKLSQPRAVAQQMAAVVEYMNFLECRVIEEALSGEDFCRMSENLTTATKPIRPTKPPLPYSRGSRLTQAGLLARYASFLVQELETVSWVLYGQRDFAKQIVIFDDAVNERCRSRRGPFFDEKALPKRARAVLESLRIDAEHVNGRERPPKRPARASRSASTR
ncbi:hypothetical protein [Bradyrhizobium neotropicale]|uniref:hypothetical protein n=1 Tax=Bradyrhizobium neotropicale TaxID=1497615 RepID=UPI001AD77F2A|nr:hypothetical protein [Bradyrhizobium neotropicale]MBO4227230.1 hypothetical protein [Bradyrhizobium neotropicale]